MIDAVERADGQAAERHAAFMTAHAEADQLSAQRLEKVIKWLDLRLGGRDPTAL